MKRLFCSLIAVAGLSARAEDAAFTPMFNGRDLQGWIPLHAATETWSFADGVVRCTGRPVSALRTERQYENFELEVEWRHLTSGGNSGVFIWGSPIPAPGVPFLRGIEVQVLDNGYNAKGKNEWYTTHGDVFPIHGATMKPFGRTNGARGFPAEDRSKSSPEWNHYRLVCSNGSIRLSVNGVQVSGGDVCRYRKGYLALESEGAPVEFRNMRIRELPSTGAAGDDIAPLDPGWKPLSTGLDLSGWKTGVAGWSMRGEHLRGDAGAGALSTEAEYGDADYVFDLQLPKDSSTTQACAAVIGGSVEVPLTEATPGAWRRFIIEVRGPIITVRPDRLPARTVKPAEAPPRGAFGLKAGSAPVEVMNLYVCPR